MGGDLKDLEATPLLEALSLAQTRVGGRSRELKLSQSQLVG